MKVAVGDFGSRGRTSSGPILPGIVILRSVLQRGTVPWPRGKLAKLCGQRGRREKSSPKGGEGILTSVYRGWESFWEGVPAFRWPEGYHSELRAEWSGDPPVCTPPQSPSSLLTMKAPQNSPGSFLRGQPAMSHPFPWPRK